MSRKDDPSEELGNSHTHKETSEESATKMTQKGLEYKIKTKTSKARNIEKKLWYVVRSVETLDPESCTDNVLRKLVSVTQEFDLLGLYKKNTNEADDRGTSLVSENTKQKKESLEIRQTVGNIMCAVP